MTRVPQPYEYRRHALEEPDWRRLPGYARVTRAEWRDAQWQRRNSATSVPGLAHVFGAHLPPDLARSIAEDVRLHSTMSLRVTPQVLNTMNEQDLCSDPIRRYTLPAASDREPVWHTHPEARRDSLREKEMSVVEGLVCRYPTKALVELTATCPVYCGHCTRMDLVGPASPSFPKSKLTVRLDAILQHLRSMPSIRDLVLSGGDIANVAPDFLESFIGKVLEISHIRSLRLATKAIVALPQHFFQDAVLRSLERIARSTRKAGVELAIHTQSNHVQSITPLVAEAAARLHEVGIPHIRNQGVLLRDVNTTAGTLLDLCFALVDETRIAPYYFYVCDLIPRGEHWRIPLHQAQSLQEQMMGYLPGFATPRIVCDVPFIGKRWVHQAESYDRVRGISYWTKNYWTPLDAHSPRERHPYFDPVATLPLEGREYWAHSSTNSSYASRAGMVTSE